MHQARGQRAVRKHTFRTSINFPCFLTLLLCVCIALACRYLGVGANRKAVLKMERTPFCVVDPGHIVGEYFPNVVGLLSYSALSAPNDLQ